MVLAYIALGGLTSAIYNEVLQFFLIFLGFLPLVILGLWDIGGWSGLRKKLADYAASHALPGKRLDVRLGQLGNSRVHNPMDIGWFGMVFGLGFVLAFGYWCTDFLVVQRAMAAESMSAARRTPVIATIPKILIPAIVIVPGMIALVARPNAKVFGRPAPVEAGALVDSELGSPLAGYGLIPPKIETIKEKGGKVVHRVKADADGKPERDYDLAIPMMLIQYFPTGLLGLGLTALMASFMSGMAGNVTAFNTVWTYDIYQSYVAPNRSDNHYLWMGRMATIFGVVVSVAAAYVAAEFNNIMDFIQLVFGFVNAPLVRHVPPGHVLEADDRARGFFGTAGRHRRLRAAHRPDRSDGPLARRSRPPPQSLYVYGTRHGAKLLDGHLRLDDLFRRDDRHLALDAAKEDRRGVRGLVYSLTHVERDRTLHWFTQPATLGVIMLAVCAVLNIIFWK